MRCLRTSSTTRSSCPLRPGHPEIGISGLGCRLESFPKALLMHGEAAEILAGSVVGEEWIASPGHHLAHFPIQRALVELAVLQVQLPMQ